MEKSNTEAKEKQKGSRNSHLVFHLICISAIIYGVFVLTLYINRTFSYQPDPENEAKIKEFLAEKSLLSKNFEKQNDTRDPFTPSVPKINTPADKEEITGLQIEPEVFTAQPEEKKIRELTGEDLGFFVTGFIHKEENSQAIITGKNGKSYLINKGQVIGKWTVSSINENEVTLETDGYIARLEPSPGYRSLKIPREGEFDGIVGIDSEDPGFRLTGIMKNNKGINAVITGTNGENYTVKVGENIGKWTVSFISEKMVFIKNNRTEVIAVLELNSDVGVPDQIKKYQQKNDTVAL